MEDPRHNDTLLALHLVGGGPLRLEERPELAGEHEGSALAALRRARQEPHLAAAVVRGEVDLTVGCCRDYPAIVMHHIQGKFIDGLIDPCHRTARPCRVPLLIPTAHAPTRRP